MKIKTIIGIILIILGIILLILPRQGEGGGYMAIAIAYPLIITGIILLLSIIGASLFFAGELILVLSIMMQSSIAKPAVNTFSWLIWLVYGLFVIGVLYGLVEGIIKLVKFIKTKK